MTIKPLRPLVFPFALIITILTIAHFLPSLVFIDRGITDLVNTTPDSWLGTMQLLTMLGDPLPLILVALIVSGWELSRRHHVRAFVMTGSLIALPTFYAVKQVVQRARPVTNYIAEHGIHGYSFPSGHATGTFAVYGMLAYLTYSHTKGAVRFILIGLCVAVIAIVSFTRVYLGVHFPTDIFAGWLLALAIITLLRSTSLLIAKRSSRPNRLAAEDSTESLENLQN